MLLAALIDAAEGIQDDQRVVLGKDFFLNLALADAQGLICDDLCDQLLSSKRQRFCHFLFSQNNCLFNSSGKFRRPIDSVFAFKIINLNYYFPLLASQK